MAEKDTILIVDDVSTNRKILSAMLTPTYSVITADSGEAALQILDSDQTIDLVLLDVMMPGIDGYEVLRQLRETERHKATPVIMVTSLESVDAEERGLMLGATDFIRKPVPPKITRLRISNYLEFVHQRRLLEELTEHDPLTGAFNRRYFDRIFDHEYKRAARAQSPISLAIADIDFFKRVNDNYGHRHGDDVLRQVATTIKKALGRPGDVVARYGGEEFAIIMPHTDAAGADRVLESVRAAVEALGIEHAASDCADVVTISIGFATAEQDYPPREALFDAADEALFMAKGEGRNRVMSKQLTIAAIA